MHRSRPPAGPIRWDAAPTRGGGTRWIATLPPDDDVRFRSLVARVAPAIERSLGAAVLANRTSPLGGPAMLRPWRPAHRRWRRSLETVLDERRAAATADVAGCYASIAPDAVGRALEHAGADRDHVRELVAWLHALERVGVVGLPIGPEPSAILANAVLSAGDRALDACGVRWFRWVDDWVFVGDGIDRALDGLADALARQGLVLHDRKTRRFTDARDALRDPHRSAASLAPEDGFRVHRSRP